MAWINSVWRGKDVKPYSETICEQCSRWFEITLPSLPKYCLECEDYEDLMQDFGGEG